MKPVAGIIAFFALTGCTIERTIVEQAPTTTQTATTIAPTTQSPATQPPIQTRRADEEGFIAWIRSEVEGTYGLESTMLETGYMVCDLAENGTTMEELAAVVVQSATDAEGEFFLNTVVASALVFLCPWAMGV